LQSHFRIAHIAFNFSFVLTLILLFTQVPHPQIMTPPEEPIRVVLNAEPTPEPIPAELEPAIPTPPPTSPAAEPAPSDAMDAPKTTTSDSESEEEAESEPAETEPALAAAFVPAAGTEAETVESDREAESQMLESETEVAEVQNSNLMESETPELDLIKPPDESENPEEENPDEPVKPMELTSSPPLSTLEEEKFLEEIQSRKEALKNYNREVASKGSDEVADRLQAASLAQKGKKWLTNTDGLREGIIRSLDTSDVPPNIAEKVLERYGIKIMMKMMDGNSGGYNFLNQAKTNGGSYFNRVGKGMYQVFSFGQPAVARMMQLEVEELKRRGYDPAKTRVTEVEFGVIQTTGGYDLGVTKIEMLPVEVSAPSATQ